MPTITADKRVNAGDLYDEIIALVPELAPTPTGPDGKLEAKIIIEQDEERHLRVHLPDEVDLDGDIIRKAIKDHKRKPEKVVDPVADARKLVKEKADQGDPLAKAVLTLLGDAP
jgi:hypothetical protein